MPVTVDLGEMFAGQSATQFWRSLEERSTTPQFRTQLERDYPEIARLARAAPDRRTALKLMGASLLMAGLAACKGPQQIVPYVRQPENVTTGIPRWQATCLALDGYGVGVVGEIHDGRPTKIEGNVLHPGSLGGTDAAMQASVWSLYDPARARSALHAHEPVSWREVQAGLARVRERHLAQEGRDMALLIGPETSPTLRRLINALKMQMPQLRLYRHAPLEPPATSEAGVASFGRPVMPLYDLGSADVIVSIGADFLGEGPGKLAYARAFTDERRVRKGRQRMSRLYVIESALSITGAAADKRIAATAGRLEAMTHELLQALEDGMPPSDDLVPIVRDLTGGKRGLIIAGPDQPVFVQRAAHRLNQTLGAPVTLHRDSRIEGNGDLEQLVDDIGAGTVSTLLCLGVDAAFSAPQDIDVAAAFGALNELWYLNTHHDATARLAQWMIPAAHELESWGDLIAYDGTASFRQPLIAPLYDGRTSSEIVACLLGDYTSSARELVRTTWSSLSDDTWHEALRTGILALPGGDDVVEDVPRPAPPPVVARSDIHLVVAPDPFLRGGQEASNLTLLELPRPMTKLVWSNAAELSPQLAARLGVAEGDELQLEREGRTITLPAFVLPGMADGTIVVTSGWGRKIAEEDAIGQNVFPLGGSGPIEVTRTGRVIGLVTTQEHHRTEGRDILREYTLATTPAHNESEPEQPSLMPDWPQPEDEAWGMSIDTSACIGCMACVSACNIENNIPVVGVEEMSRGHDMHWLRVDRYFSGDAQTPDTTFQPVPCMHCEEAPCEVVCPVNATVHTDDGLNAQIYNRCIGTRYCSQNCPYKVRRFNFFDYQENVTEESPLSLLMNPDVTVRERGVMEKCTYCVQRISAARIDSEISDTPIADGAVKTACQQACPTQAIVFGNIKDPTSRVAAEKSEPTSYTMLEELGTRPRTTYLAKVRNRG